MSDKKVTQNAQVQNDEEDRKLISSEESKNINILVEAGAGSGKTQEMAKRIVMLVKSGYREISEIVAITFTRKAANELRDRVRKMLSGAFEDTGLPDNERNNLKEALDDIHMCFIGTIHSFCSKLLRERPIEAGIDPAFVPIEDPQDESIRKKVWENYVLQANKKDKKILERMEILNVCGAVMPAFLRYICNNRDVEYIMKDENPVSFDNLTEKVRAAVVSLSDKVNEHYGKIPEDVKRGEIIPDKLQKSLMKFYRILHGSNPVDLSEKEIFSLFSIFESSGSTDIVINSADINWGSVSIATEVCDSFSNLHKQLIAPQVKERDRFIFNSILYPFTEKAIDMYDELKRTASELSNQDLLIKTADMLQKYPNVREHFQGKYKTLLIDEFQDTDPVQVAMAMYLTGKECEKECWEDITPKEGSLFVVGDPKQSIYSFRRADFSMFKKFKENIFGGDENDARVLRLTSNFRSVKSLGDWYNATFTKMLKVEKKTIYTDMITHLPDGDNTLAGVKKYMVKGDNSEEIKKNDAEALSKIIMYIADGKKRINEVDRLDENNKPIPVDRIVEYKDIMVLTPKKAHAEYIGSVLAKKDIPVKVTGTKISERTGEFSSFRNVIRMLANPNENAYVYSVLSGCFFNIPEADIQRYKQLGGVFNIYTKLNKTGEDDSSHEMKLTDADKKIIKKIEDGYAKLKRFTTYFDDISPAAAAERIIDELGILKSHLTSGDKLTGLSSFVSLVEKIRLENFSDVWGLNQFLNEMDLMIKGDIEESIDVEGDDLNAVRVMNVHKAKGLEAPIVILAVPCRPLTKQNSFYTEYNENSQKQYTGYMKLCKNPEGINKNAAYLSPGWDTIAKKAETNHKQEKERLLYVAATRAKNMLLIGAKEKSEGNIRLGQPWKELVERLPEDTSDYLEEVAKAKAGQAKTSSTAKAKKKSGSILTPDVVVKEVGKITKKREAVFKNNKPSYKLVEPSKLPALGKTSGNNDGTDTDIDADSLARKTENVICVTLRGEDEQINTGRLDIGTIVHELLETLIYDENEVGNYINATAARAKKEAVDADSTYGFITKEFLEEVVKNFKDTKLYERVRAAEDGFVYTEVPFCYKDCEQNAYITGSIDLIFKENGKWIIVDYKTCKKMPTEELDEEHKSQLDKKYQPQLDAYKKAWETMTDRKEKCGKPELFYIIKTWPDGVVNPLPVAQPARN